MRASGEGERECEGEGEGDGEGERGAEGERGGRGRGPCHSFALPLVCLATRARSMRVVSQWRSGCEWVGASGGERSGWVWMGASGVGLGASGVGWARAEWVGVDGGELLHTHGREQRAFSMCTFRCFRPATTPFT